jgi:hypothetical protein
MSDETKEPSITQQAQNLVDDTAKVIQMAIDSGQVLVSEEVKATRFAICQQCDKFNKDKNTCLLCGCRMKIKTVLAASSCPMKKW